MSGGLATFAIFIIALVAVGWWSATVVGKADDNGRRRQAELAGPLITTVAQSLLRDNESTLLRRFVADQATRFDLRVCRITIGPGRVIADARPSRIDTPVIPQLWGPIAADTAAASGPDEPDVRYPIVVPGRGIASLGLAAGHDGPRTATAATWAGVGVAAAVGLAALLLVHRRSRAALAELGLVGGALAAMAAGEDDCAALKLAPDIGPRAAAWNRMVGELDDLRRRSSLDRAVATGNRRRSPGGTLEAACDAMSQGLVLVDEHMNVRFSNGAASAFLRRDRDALLGRPAVDLVDDDKFREAIRSIAGGKLRRPVTVELEQPGEAGPGHLRFCVRPVRRGDVDAAMVIVEDVTQQRAADGARNAFVNQVTHELRTPLTNIRLYTEAAIDDRDADPAVRSNCLNVINTECRRLERIVGEMLSVAEIDAGACTVRLEDVYVEPLVEELRSDYEAQAAGKRIDLKFVLSPKLPKIQADRDKLAIALHNLIANAIKYTPDGGAVTVTADVKDGQLVVEVADTGIGIKPEEQDRIFDRFYRSTDPRVGKIVGTGLGLTLAREIVRLHGGEVTLRSELDRGSTFTATIPLPAAA